MKLVVYNMERCAKDWVTVFCDLTGYDKGKAGTDPTPFVDESKHTLVVTPPPPRGSCEGSAYWRIVPK